MGGLLVRPASRSGLPAPAAVVAIDGRSGTGKSTLAGRLREQFGAPVLEIGPLFRYAAWLNGTGQAHSARDAAGTLLVRIATESMYYDVMNAGLFAETRLLHEGRQIDEELWDERWAADVRSAASDRAVQAYVALSVRALIRGFDRVVIVGRDAGSFVAGPAGLGVVLDAEGEVRRDRKTSQLGISRDGVADLWEPRLTSRHRGVVVDTTESTVTEMTTLVAARSGCALTPGGGSSSHMAAVPRRATPKSRSILVSAGFAA